MNIDPDYDRDSEPSLIEDVVSPHTEYFTDVNREEVRRRSIGNLYRQYLRTKRKKEPKLHYENGSAGTVVSPTATSAKLKYTRVPPLQSLPSFGPNDSPAFLSALATIGASASQKRAAVMSSLKHGVSWTGTQLSKAKTIVAAAIVALVTRTRSALFGRLPKRYTATSGVVIDKRDEALSVLRFATPIILLILFLSLKTGLNPSDHPNNQGGSATSHSQVITNTSSKAAEPSKPSSSSSKGSGSSSTTGPSASGTASTPSATTSPQASNTPAPSGLLPTSGGTSTSPVTGGRGGGPIASPTSPPSPSAPTTPGVPLDTTLTIPPINVGVGGKEIIGTNGTTIHIN